jgi:hypothetical protein
MYHIDLNTEHMQVLIQALDLYSRVGMGQFEEVAHVFESRRNETLLTALNGAKVAVGLHPNSHRSISAEAVADSFKTAFDIKQVLRHRMAWDKQPDGGVGVAFDEPMRYGPYPMVRVSK